MPESFELEVDGNSATAVAAPYRPRQSQVVAVMAFGCAGVLMLGVQPLVLGRLLTDGRLSVMQLTQAATVELLSLGCVAGLLAALAKPHHLRRWGLGASLLLIVANFACLSASGYAFVGLRGLAGASGGALLWIATGVYTRAPNALRLSATFMGASALTQAALAAAIPGTAALLGHDAGLILLGGAVVVCLPLLPLFPDRLPDLPPAEKGQGALGIAGLLGLLSYFLLLAGVVGFWVFVEPLASLDGIPGPVIAYAIAASLATQVLGAALTAWGGSRISPSAGIIATALLFAVSVLVMNGIRSQTPFVASILLFGFLWTAGPPLFVPLLIRVDPTRRAALLLPATQMLGSSFGPLLTGALAGSSNLAIVGLVAVALFCGCIVAMFASLASRPRLTREERALAHVD